ncbi:DNA repair protein RecN [Methylonatrum kenyense]|uniref:DNA repair protein RecN n=1 Tax=Methylonatrum kenyense TaxID=455253 RepID=UPI0020BDDD7F|nr:DNA repair protein RecN [Methylonatrum kenyense]MCK8515781.1 DNA repair protein RecN [Methylonatrum kenyense]
MLRHITIRDFALVDRLELELHGGMTVLTGETGAGKSILLDAMGLALGDRASADAVRAGGDKAEIHLDFDLAGLPAVRHWLEQQELEADDECLIRRVVQAGGRSRGFINGSPVPVSLLRELGEQLVDLHGQHEHQSLLRRDIQRSTLDNIAENDTMLADLARQADRLAELDAEQNRLRGGHADQESRRDYVDFQLQELDALDLAPESIAKLEAEHKRLANAGDLLQLSQALLTQLSEDEDSAQSRLGQAVRALDEQLAVDPGLGECHELLASASIQLDEAVDSLRRHAEGLDLDPAHLEALNQKIQTLSDLARKHRCNVDQLIEVRDSLHQEREALDQAGERLQAINAEREALLQAYRKSALALRQRRESAAESLAEAVTAQLADLGMGGAALRIQVIPRADGSISRHGLDDVLFEVRTNPGQAFAPMHRIASGGELSRLSLAIQVVASHGTNIPVLIFDEADSGIGGGVAEVVGRHLRQLGRQHQVLCVTHLPQVAAQANWHLRVSKHSEKDNTVSDVTLLADDDRLQEVARMLGGMKLTDTTLEHAREMLERALPG